MEELGPFLFLLIAGLIQLVKFILDKSGKGKKPPAVPQEEPADREPSSIEEFFENLAQKLEPKPTEMPEWPEERERPDYLKEQEEFEVAQATAYEEEQEAEIIPMPPPMQPTSEMDAVVSAVNIQAVETASLKSAMKAMPSSIVGLKGMQIASAPILRSSSAGSIDFPLKDKAKLREAIIANIVFSPPRAYATDFENTVIK